MPKCSFSGESIQPGTGTMYVMKDGKILWFKNSKSMKNYLDLKRNPRNIRWTEIHREAFGKGKKKLGKKEEGSVKG